MRPFLRTSHLLVKLRTPPVQGEWRRQLFTLIALIALLSASLAGKPPTGLSVPIVKADDPKESTNGSKDVEDRNKVRPHLAQHAYRPMVAYLLHTSDIRRFILLTAGHNGPYFSLSDLHAYTPPPPKPCATPGRLSITPPVWTKYPDELKNTLPFPRDYTSETVAYLAQHEIRYGDRQTPHVALTFDCETGVGSTKRILETLHQEDVKATFFVQGKYAYMYPEMIREMVAGGHELGSHSFFHPLFTDISPITATNEITYTEAAIARAVGEYLPMRYFRFPYGGRNNATRMHVAALGYQSAFWDVDPRGWEPDKAPKDIIEHVRKTAHYGAIVIMHCSSWDDANALSGVIQAIRDKDLIPGTLSDVITEEDRNVPGYHLPTPP